MKKNYTHIEFVIDRSGSMASIATEAANSINNFVEEQKKVDGTATFGLTQFDTFIETLSDFIDLQEASPYFLEPRGTTALMDAVGRRINALGQRLSSLSAEDRPEKVVFVIVTDGLENASQEFSREQIKDMIAKQQDEFSWSFVFLAANQDAFATANAYGISVSNAMNFCATPDGVTRDVTSLSNAVKTYRTSTDIDPQAIL